MFVINLWLGLNRALKVSVTAQKLDEGIFGIGEPGGIERILIRKFGYEQQARIREQPLSTGEFHDTEVVGRFEEKVDAQASYIGNYADLHFFKLASILQRLT